MWWGYLSMISHILCVESLCSCNFICKSHSCVAVVVVFKSLLSCVYPQLVPILRLVVGVGVLSFCSCLQPPYMSLCSCSHWVICHCSVIYCELSHCLVVSCVYEFQSHCVVVSNV